MAEGQLDAFVFNVLVLRHLARTEFPGGVRVLPGAFDHYYLKMAMPTGSPHREAINQGLLAVVESPGWHRQMERYIGAER